MLDIITWALISQAHSTAKEEGEGKSEMFKA